MDWLDDFKKDAEEFNNSKYGKLTDAELAQRSAFLDSNIQSELGTIGGKVIAEKRKEEGYFQSEYWSETSRRGIETQRKLGIGIHTTERPQEWIDASTEGVAKWREENPELAKRISQENFSKAQDWCRENYYGTEAHESNFAKARKIAHETKVECTHCGDKVSISTIDRWHNDNCHVNTMRHLYEAFPENTPMTKKEMLEFFKSNGFEVDAKLITKFAYKHPWITVVPGGINGAPGKYEKKI